jgi:hypothetical protein
VLFTYAYITNPEVGATDDAAYQMVERVEAIDDHTVKVHFKDTNPAWARPFVGVAGTIIPRHLFEPYNGPNAQEALANRMAIGTGPYWVASFVEEDFLIIGEDIVNTIKILYEINPYYREPDKPYSASPGPPSDASPLGSSDHPPCAGPCMTGRTLASCTSTRRPATRHSADKQSERARLGADAATDGTPEGCRQSGFQNTKAGSNVRMIPGNRTPAASGRSWCGGTSKAASTRWVGAGGSHIVPWATRRGPECWHCAVDGSDLRTNLDHKPARA